MGHKLLLHVKSTDLGILQEGWCSPHHCEQTDYKSDELILRVWSWFKDECMYDLIHQPLFMVEECFFSNNFKFQIVILFHFILTLHQHTAHDSIMEKKAILHCIKSSQLHVGINCWLIDNPLQINQRWFLLLPGEIIHKPVTSTSPCNTRIWGLWSTLRRLIFWSEF